MNEIILEISAFCVALFCIVDCFKNRKELYLPIPKGFANKIGDQHFTYLALLISLMVSAFCSSVEIAMEEYMIQSKVILYILNEIYYLFHTSLPLFFALYIVNMTDAGSGRKKKFFYYVSAPSLAGLLLVVLNPITKMIFYINENYTYQRGDYLWVLYAIGVCYIVMGIIFELPLVAWLLGVLGVLHRGFFRTYRRHAVIALLLLAAIVTPTGDPFTLMVVFLPIYLLYEVSAYLVPAAARPTVD